MTEREFSAGPGIPGYAVAGIDTESKTMSTVDDRTDDNSLIVFVDTRNNHGEHRILLAIGDDTPDNECGETRAELALTDEAAIAFARFILTKIGPRAV